MKEKIAKWYKQGLWSEEMVMTATQKGVITQDEVNEILDTWGISYAGDYTLQV